MTDHPHVTLDVTAALHGAPAVVVDIHDRMTAEQALATSMDLRSAALVTAELNRERERPDHQVSDQVAVDLVTGS
jgi:hypothetical protein